ncbi:PGPGW domain-containing protein [Solirubrobacter sp. CPCC 204708]|uniref:PGPGW domain-containing protein n=1 Tax=Solirubrobacter deserti TaxID=2282478 RepID=A0ABT4RI19_9ACTN|nr:PGPGW domain-containing protein [Solirubrobacter deserti]MBE2318788.1 PGPGW domain-containing protein [Solirubrobacter deserti]MDA0138168.1 PGPGW domain-containing protein [Solirubrobacter deserti]
MSDENAAKPPLIDRLRAQRATHKDRGLIVRIGLVVVGFTVLIAGLVMVVFPGPALAVIPIGLAILSLEFAWAARLLEVALEQAEKAKMTAKETTRTQRIIVAIAVVLGVAAIGIAVAIWGIPSWVPVIGGFNR